MNKQEYRQAVKAARLVIGFIPIAAGRLKGVKISKKNALFLVNTLPDDKPILAEWGDPPDNTILFVGDNEKGR